MTCQAKTWVPTRYGRQVAEAGSAVDFREGLENSRGARNLETLLLLRGAGPDARFSQQLGHSAVSFIHSLVGIRSGCRVGIRNRDAPEFLPPHLARRLPRRPIRVP